MPHRAALHGGRHPVPVADRAGPRGLRGRRGGRLGGRHAEGGDRVAFTWRPRCGFCEFCMTGRPVMCIYGRVQARSGGLDGRHLRPAPRRGAGAPLPGCLLLRRSGRWCPSAPWCRARGVPPAVAAVTGCAVITGLGAVVNVAGQVAGRPLLVIGAGGVGLSAVMGAAWWGPTRWSWSTWRRRSWSWRSSSAPPTRRRGSLDAAEVVAAVQDLTGGGAEVASRRSAARRPCARPSSALRPGGTAIAVGLAAVDATASIPINELVQQQKHLVGSLYGSANPPIDLPRILSLYQARTAPAGSVAGRAAPPRRRRRGLPGLRTAPSAAPW